MRALMGLAELDSLRVWLERCCSSLVSQLRSRPPGYSCREHRGPGLTVSWCEGFSSLRLCWRYRRGPWYCSELNWEEVRRMLEEYRTWLKGVVAGWQGL